MFVWVLGMSGGGYGGFCMSLMLCRNRYNDVYVDIVCSHLSHSRVLFHLGHSPEQTWWGRGWGDLKDPAEVGGVNGGLLRMEQ